MGYSAIVYYAKGENKFQRLLHNLKNCDEEPKRCIFEYLKNELDAKFMDRQYDLFNDCNDALVDEIIEKAENMLSNDEFNLNELDLPTHIALYWICSTLYFDIKNKSINPYRVIPCFTGTSIGEFWAITMACRKDQFSDKECILIAYEYGRVLSEVQSKSENEKHPLELITSFSSKYFSDYYTKPLPCIGINESRLVSFDSVSNIPSFITPRQTDSLVEVVSQSFYNTPDENELREKIHEKMTRFSSYKLVEF